MPIFDKQCPLCGKALPNSANYCECGFSFNPAELDDTTQSLVLAAQEEELYENYLSARAAQAEEALTVALNLLAKDPDNPAKKQDAARLSEEAKQTRAEYTTQHNKAAATRKVARNARQTLETLKQSYAQEQQAKARESRTTRANIKHEQQVAKAKALAAQADKHIQAAKAARQQPKVAVRPATSAPPKQPGLKPAKPQAIVSKQATQAFRATQSAKAESAMKALKAAKAAMHLAQAKQDADKASAAAFKTAQAAKAAAIQKRAAAKTAECPHCSARLPLNAKKCGCGYVLKAKRQMQNLTVSEADRAAMSKFDKADSSFITKPK